MRVIPSAKITRVVSLLCVKANLSLRKDILSLLKSAHKKEENKKADSALEAIIRNATEAMRGKLAICQDTGLASVFVELGQDVRVVGNLNAAIQKGVASGYKKGFLRSSVVKDPLARGKPGYGPAIIHVDLVKGSRLKLTVLPKGFGCENKARLKMFLPTAGVEEIKRFIVETVKGAGPDACPPYVVGVGIGGTADYAMLLAKKALLRKHTAYSLQLKALEDDLLKEINKLNIGPMGLGGKNTVLAVKINTYPTHIAGLPVAVNISCHALRSAAEII